MIVTLRLAEEKIKESHFQKGGCTPKTLRFQDSSGREHACEREARAPATNRRATKCRTPTSSSTHAREPLHPGRLIHRISTVNLISYIL